MSKVVDAVSNFVSEVLGKKKEEQTFKNDIAEVPKHEGPSPVITTTAPVMEYSLTLMSSKDLYEKIQSKQAELSSLDSERVKVQDHVMALRERGYAVSLARSPPAAFLGSGSKENYARMQKYKKGANDRYAAWKTEKNLAEDRLNQIQKRKVELESEIRELRKQFGLVASIEESSKGLKYSYD